MQAVSESNLAQLLAGHVNSAKQSVNDKKFEKLAKSVKEMENLLDEERFARDAIVAALHATQFVGTLSEWLFVLDKMDPIREAAPPGLLTGFLGLIALCWNLSDLDFKIACEMTRHQLADFMMYNVMQRVYLRKIHDTKSFEFYIVKGSLSTIHNMIRFPGERDKFASPTFKHTLSRLLADSKLHEILHLLACLCLANLIGECESDEAATTTATSSIAIMLNHAKLAVSTMIRVANLAAKHDKHTKKDAAAASSSSTGGGGGRADCRGRYLGFTALEMIQGLQAVSSVECARRAVAQTDTLDFLDARLKTLCKQADSDKAGGGEMDLEEALAVTSVLWNLAFDSELQPAIASSSSSSKRSIVTSLNKIVSTSKHRELRGNAEAILALCNQHVEDAKSAASKFSAANLQISQYAGGAPVAAEKEGQQFDVFISYCHRNSEKIYPIVYKLKDANVRVWLDLDQMKDSMLDAMATGIENSKAVMICMSEDYKESPNCKAEAEYAFLTHRNHIIPLLLSENFKPKGWLGMILGCKFYYDFSGSLSFEEMSAKLIGTLQHSL